MQVSPLLNDDLLRLNTLIKEAASVEGLLYAIIIDRQQVIQADPDTSKIGTTLQLLEGKKNVKKEKNINYFDYALPSGSKVLNLSRPITFRDKELGTAHVGISLDFIKDLIRKETVSILILSLFIILFEIAIAILLGIEFSRPISNWF